MARRSSKTGCFGKLVIAFFALVLLSVFIGGTPDRATSDSAGQQRLSSAAVSQSNVSEDAGLNSTEAKADSATSTITEDALGGQDATPAPSVEPASGDVPQVTGTLQARFLNVGQGDSEFIVLPNGQTMLIDAGEAWAGDYVVQYIQNTLGCDHIDYLVATHPDSDHIGGLPAVLYSPIKIGEVYAPEVSNDTQAFWDFLTAVEAIDHQITPATAGMVLYEEPGCRVEVVSPAADQAYESMDDWSVVIKISFGATSFLFTGDASYKVIQGLDIGHVDVLKVGHHGSDTAVSIPLLEALSPSLAVIEAGWNNPYGLPSIETLDELEYCDVQTWRTDVDGVVSVISDGTSLTIYSESTGSNEPVPRAEVEARAEAERVEREAGEAARQAAIDAAAQAQDEAAYEEAVADTYDAGRTVYITDTGEKYHTGSCRTLRQSKYPIGINDAIAMGYEPCGICKPGR